MQNEGVDDKLPYHFALGISVRIPWMALKMGKEIIFLVEEAPEGGYTARALGHAIFTEADSWEELKEAILDAVHAHFEDIERPSVVRLHAVREEVLAV